MRPDSLSIGYGAPSVVRMTGLTYRQLDYWDREGIAHPSIRSAGGSGSRRLYSDVDVVRLCILRTVLDSGVNHVAMRRLAAALTNATLAAAEFIVVSHEEITPCASLEDVGRAIDGTSYTYTLINVSRIAAERIAS